VKLNYVEIKAGKYTVLVSRSDLPRLSGRHISVFKLSGVPYAFIGGHIKGQRKWGVRLKREQLHRFLTGAKPAELIDHRNRKTLDCRRSNLRRATRQQNGANSKLSKANSSGFKGVSWVARTGKWSARIKYDYRNTHIGYFFQATEAARAYDMVARELFGEFAYQNFPRRRSS
jgi:hypothetical protein